ncbi:MAG: NADH-quinone oxidoreductase subunit NuoH [Candidatus Sumerlaeia bacterium]|nr:NADH-quinone oxidoreductase subunit NuoH [Candidatus Sumerlaeia bacterium]
MPGTLTDIINYVIQTALGVVGLDYARVPEMLRIGAAMLIACGAMLGYVAVVALFFGWAERRVAGRIQARQGPNIVGPFGLLQLIADAIKILVKEDIIPQTAHRFLFRLAPILVFMGAFAPFVVLPFSETLVVSNLSLGVYYALSFAALEVVGVIMAGWASNNKWSLYGGMRLAAQMMSYEIPMGLAVLTVAVLSGHLNLRTIVLDQQGYWIFSWNVFRGFPWAFLAMFVFYLAGLAGSKRTPFDLPEAESEIVAGYHTEYSGMRFVIFYLSEYATMYVVSALTAVLFLGGWHGPIPHVLAWDGQVHWEAGPVLSALIGMVNMIGKSFFLMFVMLWFRWTYPRVRVDQIVYLCMKVLVPLGIICLMGASAWALVW